MNATERHDVSRALALSMAGDRTGCNALLRRLRVVPTKRDDLDTRQLMMAFVEFRCERLGTEGVAAHVCVARQRANDIQRTQQTSRGQGTDFPFCDSRSCTQGRAIREALDPRVGAWRGHGPGGRHALGRTRADVIAQAKAKARLERVGLIDLVPTLDEVPRSDEEDE